MAIDGFVEGQLNNQPNRSYTKCLPCIITANKDHMPTLIAEPELCSVFCVPCYVLCFMCCVVTDDLVQLNTLSVANGGPWSLMYEQDTGNEGFH